jgi:hypothetical protein
VEGVMEFRTGYLDIRILSRFVWLSLLLSSALIGARYASAQNTPLISGAAGFLSSTNAGTTDIQPVIAPVAVVPLGSRFLIESRADIRGFFQPKDGTGPYQGQLFTSLQYLQLDYIATSRLTVTAGRFLTPFGTYNERLSPIWIDNFQNAPLISAIGTRTTGSSDGVMIRGAAFSTGAVQINYLAYFSAEVAQTQFAAARTAGDRIDIFFPKQRLEVGTSYGRFLQGQHSNSVGGHLWWQPWRVPLQVRSEYAHGPHAQGYWIEASYRLSQWRGVDSLLGRLEPAFRMQQAFRDSPGVGDGLPSVNTTLPEFALSYHLPNEVKLNGSYSRQIASTGNHNIWETSITYRFLFPAWRGR